MADTKQTPRAETRLVPREDWQAYFDRFSRRYLQHERDDQSEMATLEVISPSLGDQLGVQAVRLLGMSYDHKDNVFVLQLEGMDHLVFDPADVWVVEGNDGFVSAVELTHADGTKELIYIRKAETASSDDELPAAPT